jgi:hypothetical protein
MHNRPTRRLGPAVNMTLYQPSPTRLATCPPLRAPHSRRAASWHERRRYAGYRPVAPGGAGTSPQRRFLRAQQRSSHRLGIPAIADRLVQRHLAHPPRLHTIVAAAHRQSAAAAAPDHHHHVVALHPGQHMKQTCFPR